MVKWLYDNYFIVSFICLFYLVLIGFGTYQMFYDITKITTAATVSYNTLMLLPAIVSGLLKWRVEKDNK